MSNKLKVTVVDGAVKYDNGKSPVFRGALSYFPEALKLVAKVSEFGANKYAWEGWRHVEDGENRYKDGLARHFMSKDDLDAESGFPELAHVAWNALAILELYLERKKNERS